ncbi:MAG: stage III sporulation protein AF [Lachnospiraceae bacterium]|nr:stage III sporulation protein AF [Lachnospiraceae bacterium]
MQSAFLEAVCRIGIFMICAQTIMHFRPKGAYEKYLKLLVSIMVLIQFLQPFNTLFGKKGASDPESRAWQIFETIGEQAKISEESAARSEQILERMTLSEVERLLSQSGATQQTGDEQDKEGGTGEEVVGSERATIEKIESVERVTIGQKEGDRGSEGKVEAVDR